MDETRQATASQARVRCGWPTPGAEERLSVVQRQEQREYLHLLEADEEVGAEAGLRPGGSGDPPRAPFLDSSAPPRNRVHGGRSGGTGVGGEDGCPESTGCLAATSQCSPLRNAASTPHPLRHTFCVSMAEYNGDHTWLIVIWTKYSL